MTLSCGFRPEDWRAYFIGAWRMDRRIDDRRGARAGVAAGEAVIAASDNTASAICTEALMIDYGGRRFAGEQTMLWRFDDAAGPTLLFRDGRRFVAMRFLQDEGFARASFSHVCGEDRYEGAAHIGDDSTWRLVWKVSGPRKDFTLDTLYVRIGESEARANACGKGAVAAGCVSSSWRRFP